MPPVVFSDRLVVQVCERAAATVTGVATDPLDSSVWVRLATPADALTAHSGLTGYGLAAVVVHDTRVHVTGWDAGLLRWRLGTVLSGVDDLQLEWDTTLELADYLYRQHAARTSDGRPDPANVLADLEAGMRRAIPFPAQAPDTGDIGTLLNLIDVAENAYERLIQQHLDHAEHMLTERHSYDTT